jgi:hypothetical protein
MRQASTCYPAHMPATDLQQQQQQQQQQPSLQPESLSNNSLKLPYGGYYSGSYQGGGESSAVTAFADDDYHTLRARLESNSLGSSSRQHHGVGSSAGTGSGSSSGGVRSRLCEELDAFLAYVIAEERRRYNFFFLLQVVAVAITMYHRLRTLCSANCLPLACKHSHGVILLSSTLICCYTSFAAPRE